MEDTLRVTPEVFERSLEAVLILVLMEDTLRGCGLTACYGCRCLNPCFNGRYSQSQPTLTLA